MILAGDIGGTKTILALFEGDGRSAPAVEDTFQSREHETFDEIVLTFLARHKPKVRLACVGVAGPVKHGRSQATNLPWVVDAATLATELGVTRAWLINDLEAYAYGVGALGPEDLLVLNAGARDVEGNRCVIAAGTGLGEAGLFREGTSWHPFATEGGHTDFAPSNELEIELLRFLIKEYGRVSWERLVSGPGLVNIYHFLRDTGREDEPTWLAEAMRAGDPGAVIGGHARDGRSPLCAKTLDIFLELYGAEAGNLALTTMATGGVYVGGGPAAKNLERLKEGAFLRRFTAKGRMRALLEAIPVRVILSQRTGLLGAAQGAFLRGSG